VWKAAFLIANGQLKERGRAPIALRPDAQQFPEATVELVEALRTLSPRQRSSVILHYYQGYTLRETAQLLGSTIPTIAVHLRRARSKLKDYLEADDG
jgi:RNA polymerase sigma-70 factor (ECF subfamily)